MARRTRSPGATHSTMADRDAFHTPSRYPDSACKLVSLVLPALMPIGSRERSVERPLTHTHTSEGTPFARHWDIRGNPQAEGRAPLGLSQNGYVRMAMSVRGRNARMGRTAWYDTAHSAAFLLPAGYGRLGSGCGSTPSDPPDKSTL